MSYRIIYTEESEQDLVSVYRYIAMNLLVPETAKKQIDRIMNAIKGLDAVSYTHLDVYKRQMIVLFNK